MDQKVLITGASGLIGRELCRQLYEKYHITAIDNNFRYDYVPLCHNYIKADISDYCNQTKNNFDYIFHMGAINGTKYFYDIPNTLLENNIKSDFSIFNFAKSKNGCKIIYGSSSEIVSDTDIIPTPEIVDINFENIHNPRWSYRLAKIVGENYLVNSDLDYLILRFFNIFGPASGSGHFIRDLLEKIEKKDYTLIGADETRSFCRVEDAVDAVINIFKIADRTVVNIGSNEELTILEAANLIARCKETDINWTFIPRNSGSTLRRKPDIKKLLEFYPDFKPAKFKDAIKDL